MKKKIRVAVTGGIGGGKSAFCNYLAVKGYIVLSADDISKELLVNNEQVRKEVIKYFGKESYTNSKLNKAFLAERVFNNPAELKKLNSIIHPKVIDEIIKKMSQVIKKSNIVFVEAALIYEAKMEEMFDYVIVVTADEELRKKRVAARGWNEEEFIKRSSFQISEDKKKKKADFVFENNGTIKELNSKADFFLKLLGVDKKNVSSVLHK